MRPWCQPGTTTGPGARTPRRVAKSHVHDPVRPVTFEGMENLLRPLIVIGGSVVLTLLIGWRPTCCCARPTQRHHETPLWGLLRRCRMPLPARPVRGLAQRRRTTRRDLLEQHRTAVGRTLTLVLIGATAWLVVRIATAVVESTYARYARAHRDPARVRRVRTQVTLISGSSRRSSVWWRVASMLLTFPAMRAVGTSMLASAGLLGIVAGIAAQSTLGNLFAGLQIAFGDMVRIGDTVVVDGRVGHGRGDHPDLPDRPHLGRAPHHDAGLVLHHEALRELVARRRPDDRHGLPPPRPRRAAARDARQLRDILRGRAPPGTAATRTWPSPTRPPPPWRSAPSSPPRTRTTCGRSASPSANRLIPWLTENHPYALPRVNTADAVLPPTHPNAHQDGATPRTNRSRVHEPPRATGRG